MKKIIGYEIISAHSPESLEILVSEKLVEEWQPWGDVHQFVKHKISQAMVRYQEGLPEDSEDIPF